MAELIVTHANGTSERVSLDRRLRVTIGRSVRNDVCIADPFASRVHAEVRCEGDLCSLRDLNSANGTFYNGRLIDEAVTLASGDSVRIGETEIRFRDDRLALQSSATVVVDGGGDAPGLPASAIAVTSGHRTTSGLLQTIEGAHSGMRQRVDNNVSSGAAHPAASAAGAAAERDERGDLLALISKVGVTLLSPATLDETLRQIVSLVFEAVPADRCLIALRESGGEELTVRVARHREREATGGEFRLSSAVIQEVIERGNSVLTSDARLDPRFMSGTMSMQGVRSVLAVPLGVNEEIFGLIYADSPIADAMFGEDHLKVLTTLASVAAIRVENARLVEQHVERERMGRELQLAREIQQRFQPLAPPHVAGCELEGISFPCNEIGGDYYDFIERDGGRVMIALGDVSGKGTGAALLMSSLHAAVHAQVTLRRSLVEMMTAVNRYLAENIPPNRFVTFFCAEIDPATKILRYVNAGHNPPFIARADGSLMRLPADSLPLGINPAERFVEGERQLLPGDALVVYSDGVSETLDPTGEEFGETRIHQVVAQNLDATASRLRDRIESALTLFAQGTPAADDITLVIAKLA